MSRKKKVMKRMKEMNITHLQIARYVVLSLTTLISWIDGSIEIPYFKVWKICELLNLEPDDVVAIV